MTFRLWRVAALLFGSGACALIYQVTWFRELRLIFGASTASSSAVLAIFMGGLGFGGALLGKRADKAQNPLRLYAHLELGIALCAALTVPLVIACEKIYIAVGGATTLGGVGATIVRLLLSVIILGPTTFLMGGTLPSAARAVERDDSARHRVATLYGVNTFGAVVGAVAASFVLLEVFGDRLTLWLACLVNALVGLFARALSRTTTSEVEDEAVSVASTETPEPEAPKAAASTESKSTLPKELAWFAPLAAGVSGLVFMLMELVWYRMLAPILGGTSYTFGLILAVALVGIGIGSGIYARVRDRAATLLLFAVTCMLEALFVIVPYALGDRLALLSLLLRPLSRASFGSSILVWTGLAMIVVLPAAIVAGFQFPTIISLYGKGKKEVGRDVGNAYLANTIGAIIGALGGGFGLVPLLGALGCWRAAVLTLVATGVLAMVLARRRSSLNDATSIKHATLVVGAMAAVLVCVFFSRGPTAVWRHSGIGAGRADGVVMGPRSGFSEELERFNRQYGASIAWEADGIESSVALAQNNGYAFVLNGKVDGHSIGDAPTQIMSGLVLAINHPSPKSSMVIGLGTGSTAGWLGAIPEMERVDVVELEPAILDIAKACAPVNHDVLNNPKVHIALGDAREVLRTTPKRYDIIFSEPSNPYRAGISSLFTVEFYRAVKERLNEGGVFTQWLQLYEVDGWVVGTVLTSLREVFGSVSLWKTRDGDLLAIADPRPDQTVDVGRIRSRIATEPYASALTNVWHTATVEGILAHHIGGPQLADAIVKDGLGAINTDDQNLLEFAFARSINARRSLDLDLERLSIRLGFDRPKLVGGVIDESLLFEEKVMRARTDGVVEPTPSGAAFAASMRELKNTKNTNGLNAWLRLGRSPRTVGERESVVENAIRVGYPRVEDWIADLPSAAHRDLARALWHNTRQERDATVAALKRAFTALRVDPWAPQGLIVEAMDLAIATSVRDPVAARTLFDVLEVPFALEQEQILRLVTRTKLAKITGDVALCQQAVRAMKTVPWAFDIINISASCLKAANDPRAAELERDLIEISTRTQPWGDTIPSPKPASSSSSRPSAPPPTEDGLPAHGGFAPDAGADAGADAGLDAGVDAAAKATSSPEDRDAAIVPGRR